ncbi:hypothetical protein ACS0TY_023082 [Phlomoides rotata]
MSVSVLQMPIDTPAAASDHTSAASQYTTRNKLDIFIYKGTLMPSGEVSTMIMGIMKEKMEPGACTFSQVSPGRLDEWWQMFQERTRWDPNVTNSQLVYKLFLQRAGGRFTDMLNYWKEKWTLKNKIPGWDTNVWEPIKAHWMDPAVIARSEQCSWNRRSEPGGPVTGMSHHKDGSRGAAEVARDIELNTG